MGNRPNSDMPSDNHVNEMASSMEQLLLSLTSLTTGVDALHDTFVKTSAAAEIGARLQSLSSITGEPVAKLYEFGQGLEAVGRKATYIPTIFADMQRALSHTDGTSRAERAFADLHLDPKQLRKMDTADAVILFASALGKSEPNNATETAGRIFGRFQTESILAIGRNPQLFQQVTQESSQTGALLEQYAKTFEGVKTKRIEAYNDALGAQLNPEISKNYASIFEAINNVGKAFTPQINHIAKDKLNKNAANSGDSAPNFGQNHYHPEFTSLEKMGFIMSGSKVQNPYDQRKIDLLQQIVQNTSVQRAGLGWGAYDANHTIRDSLLETNSL